jgi:two-component system, LytTR family, sensor kinase
MKRGTGFYIRLSVVFIFHLIFKQGDQSFSGAFEISLRSLLFSLFFIVYWMLVWEGCSYIFKRLFKPASNKRDWYRKLSFVTIILLLVVISASVAFAWSYSAFDHFFMGIPTRNDIPLFNPEIFNLPDIFRFLNINSELIPGFILFFFLVYGTHIFITSMKEAKELEISSALQKKENIAARYSALKNQIDPHFFFNSLSTLSSLIYESTELSEEFINHLSRHYRYILEANTDSLVTVERELDFLDSYFFLLNIRHQDNIGLSVSLADDTRAKCRLLPHSLLMLAENAVKHNTFTKEKPLVIEICEDQHYIIIRNNLNPRKLLRESTGVGLENIKNRYALETEKHVLVEISPDFFTVSLPKIS